MAYGELILGGEAVWEKKIIIIYAASLVLKHCFGEMLQQIFCAFKQPYKLCES